MTNEELKIQIVSLLPSAVFEEGGEWVNVFVTPAEFRAFAENLRSDKSCVFDYLFCLTCVDWKTHFTMVYHFTSTQFRHQLVVKSKLNRVVVPGDKNGIDEIETVCDIWRTAELLEREVYDLFGVKFLNHPDLRRLLLTDDWVGHPLRKDYDDPVNMIKL